MMKKVVNKILIFLVKPFYGTGIGKYPPFKQVHSLFSWIHRMSSDSKIKLLQLKEFNIYINPKGEALERDLIVKGNYEKEIIHLLKKHIKKENVVIDVGANIGYHTLFFSKFVGTKGKVIAFEPVKENFLILKKNIEYNKISNVKLFNVGLSNKECEENIYLDTKNLGAHSIHDKKSGQKERITLSIFDNLGIKKVDVIKIDVEGHELEVLEGMKETIRQNKKVKILFEYSPELYKKIGDNSRKHCGKILSLLLKNNFDLFVVEEDMKKISNKRKFIEQHMRKQVNILAIKNEQAR